MDRDSMGYIAHHALVVTGWDGNRIESVHEQAMTHADVVPVTPVSDPAVNGYCSFAMLPDGSKEGWAYSDDGEAARSDVIGFIKSQGLSGYVSYVLVRFGGDESELAQIEDHD